MRSPSARCAEVAAGSPGLLPAFETFRVRVGRMVGKGIVFSRMIIWLLSTLEMKSHGGMDDVVRCEIKEKEPGRGAVSVKPKMNR